MARPRTFAPSRRQTVWSSVMPRISVDGLSSTQALGLNIGAQSGGGVTLVRSRGAGQYRFRPAAANDVHVVGVGLIVVNSDAFAIGATAIPSPTDDIDAEWIYHRIFAPAVAFEAYASGLNEFTEYFEFDSKAMRKLHPGDTLVWTTDGIVSSGSPVSDISAACRFLVKLG